MHAPAHSHESSAPRTGKCPFFRLFGAPSSLAADLRERTRDQHSRAEHHPVQAHAVRGQLDRVEYAAYAAQLLRVQQALEAALDRAAARDPRVGKVFQPHHRRVPAFEADLQQLDPTASARETTRAAEETAAWIAALATVEPTAPLGVLYVLEGSTNGGQFIAAALRRAWGDAEGLGLVSLDPHGARTRELWQGFRASVDALTFSDRERAAIIAAAGETFDRITAIMDEVQPRMGVVGASVVA